MSSHTQNMLHVIPYSFIIPPDHPLLIHCTFETRCTPAPTVQGAVLFVPHSASRLEHSEWLECTAGLLRRNICTPATHGDVHLGCKDINDHLVEPLVFCGLWFGRIDMTTMLDMPRVPVTLLLREPTQTSWLLNGNAAGYKWQCLQVECFQATPGLKLELPMRRSKRGTGMMEEDPTR
eukprot:1160058-Pelagomonas_calceolata.AAC.5